MNYEIIESSQYSEQIEAIFKGNWKRLDDILNGMLWALSENPFVYEIVPKMKDIRLLKTVSIPKLRIWFKVDGPKQIVHLLAVEIYD